MRALTLLRPDTAIPLLRELATWYIKEIVRIPKRGYLYSKTLNAILSISFLFRTLFAPWKNIIDTPKQLNIFTIGPMLALNGISRCVGAVVRTGAIVVALFLQILLLAITIICFLVWIAYPPALLFGVAHLLLTLSA